MYVEMLPDTTGSRQFKVAADKPEVIISQITHRIVRNLDRIGVVQLFEKE